MVFEQWMETRENRHNLLPAPQIVDRLPRAVEEYVVIVPIAYQRARVAVNRRDVGERGILQSGRFGDGANSHPGASSLSLGKSMFV